MAEPTTEQLEADEGQTPRPLNPLEGVDTTRLHEGLQAILGRAGCERLTPCTVGFNEAPQHTWSTPLQPEDRMPEAPVYLSAMERYPEWHEVRHEAGRFSAWNRPQYHNYTMAAMVAPEWDGQWGWMSWRAGRYAGEAQVGLARCAPTEWYGQAQSMQLHSQDEILNVADTPENRRHAEEVVEAARADAALYGERWIRAFEEVGADTTGLRELIRIHEQRMVYRALWNACIEGEFAASGWNARATNNSIGVCLLPNAEVLELWREWMRRGVSITPQHDVGPGYRRLIFPLNGEYGRKCTGSVYPPPHTGTMRTTVVGSLLTAANYDLISTSGWLTCPTTPEAQEGVRKWSTEVVENMREGLMDLDWNPDAPPPRQTWLQVWLERSRELVADAAYHMERWRAVALGWQLWKVGSIEDLTERWERQRNEASAMAQMGLEVETEEPPPVAPAPMPPDEPPTGEGVPRPGPAIRIPLVPAAGPTRIPRAAVEEGPALRPDGFGTPVLLTAERAAEILRTVATRDNADLRRRVEGAAQAMRNDPPEPPAPEPELERTQEERLREAIRQFRNNLEPVEEGEQP